MSTAWKVRFLPLWSDLGDSTKSVDFVTDLDSWTLKQKLLKRPDGGSALKNLPAMQVMQEMWVPFLG